MNKRIKRIVYAALVIALVMAVFGVAMAEPDIADPGVGRTAEQENTPKPTAEPTAEPTPSPTPTASPTAEPAASPTATPAVTPTATPDSAFAVTKHPGNESVIPGGKCSFIAAAKNAADRHWYFYRNGETIDAAEGGKRFSGLSVSGAGDDKLLLTNIPASLNGWQVFCTYTGVGGSISTDKAKITVADKPTPKPTEKPAQTTAKPTEKPAPLPTAEPVTAPSHTHSYTSKFENDETYHWLECECGQRANMAEHVIPEWTIVEEPNKKAPGKRFGTCVICERNILQEIPYEGKKTVTPVVLIVSGAALAAIAGALYICEAKRLRRK